MESVTGSITHQVDYSSWEFLLSLIHEIVSKERFRNSGRCLWDLWDGWRGQRLQRWQRKKEERTEEREAEVTACLDGKIPWFSMATNLVSGRHGFEGSKRLCRIYVCSLNFPSFSAPMINPLSTNREWEHIYRNPRWILAILPETVKSFST